MGYISGNTYTGFKLNHYFSNFAGPSAKYCFKIIRNGVCEQWELKLFATLKVLRSRTKKDVSNRSVGCERCVEGDIAQQGVKMRGITERPTFSL